MSLLIQVASEGQQHDFEHGNGPLEIGRGPQRDVRRFQIDDLSVSRDQLRIEELPNGNVRLENLSQRTVGNVVGNGTIDVGQIRELSLPIQIQVGKTRIAIAARDSSGATAALAASAYLANGVAEIAATPTQVDAKIVGLTDLAGLASIPPEPESRSSVSGSSRAMMFSWGIPTDEPTERLADWLQTIIELQKDTPSSETFYEKAARALVNLIELDLGLVLLRQENGWKIVGAATADNYVSVRYSRTLVDHVARERQTFYQDLDKLGQSTASLADVEAAMASPIFGLGNDVVGVLYGSRGTGRIVSRGPIGRLEAQLAQLLAAAVGTNLTRAGAMKTRLQFEQFFSPDLVRELERDPDLLDGRMAEVTILFSDLRGFTAISQRLGATKTCSMLRDMMERLTDRIIEFGGAIVDFAGDGIMAMWNAPTPQPDHAVRACRAALAMLGELPSLNQRWAGVLPSNEGLALGIGINTGPAQVGNTGSSRRFKYGPHGHAVNLASRVQDATKKLRVPLLITAPTRALLPDGFQTRRLGMVRLPNVADPEMLFEPRGEEATAHWLTLRDVYEAALAQYESQRWSQACHTLLPIVGAFQDQGQCDGPTLALMRRAWECLETRPQPFEAIIEVSTK